jgi:sn-glycerol 3-phosphate transport system substrate-binding protein
LRFLQVVAAAAVLVLTSPARAATDIMLWHAMSGELGRQLEKLAADFNASQSDYRIMASYKGNYTETVTAAIFAFRSRGQPAIVQVNEVATATMTAAKGAIYPVFQLMRDQDEPFSPDAYLPAVSGYYADAAGNLLSFPFNASTPILYYNRNMFRDAGLDPEAPPKTWPEVGTAAKRLRERGAVCGFTTSWPSWINIENFSAFHNLPLATRVNGFAGLDAELTINNPPLVRHIAQLAEWQKDKVFDYSGRGQSAEPRFQNGECGIFIGSPQNSIIGGATLWVLRDRPRDEYKGVAKFFAYLSRPEVQAAWHQNTGYLPITRTAFELTRTQGFYDRNPGSAISIEEITLHPPTENSRGIRLGSFVLVRGAIEDELEQAFSGKKPAQVALDAAVERGNKLLRQFERASPDR